MKTVAAHNAPQVGHYEFRPKSGTVTMIGAPDYGRDIMTSLFEACGWRVNIKRKKTRAKQKNHESR